MAGKVVGVCISEKRGTAKKNVGRGYLRAGLGLEGDGHAGTFKEVSLAMAESARRLAGEHNLEAVPGDFAENILIEGIDLRTVTVGQRLRVGAALLEVVQIGKDVQPHHYSFHGLRLLPTEGVFCRVLGSGPVAVGDPVELVTGA
ncbi:MAG: MOSC domain-containing protein [Thermoanaerobacterales bacterium]|nr:MOSC domain-containing protein [Bacillota bacterium]MDI6907677.1 MOSC domain-containing protein [Thermoanaerobacterales bacterium]